MIILRNKDQVHVIELHLIKNSYSLKLNSNTQKIVVLPIYLSAAGRRERERRHGAAKPEMLILSRTSSLFALIAFTHLNHASSSCNFSKFVSAVNQLISSHTEASLGTFRVFVPE